MTGTWPLQLASSVERGLFPSVWQRRGTAFCLLLLIAAELVFLASGAWPPRLVAWLALLAASVLAGTRLGVRERALVGICLALAALLQAAGDAADLAKALDQASFLAAFIQTMGLLREAAAHSPAVQRCGLYLTRQPPPRRYLAIHAGGHLFGVLLNFGAISLLAPLIQRGVQADGAPADIAEIRERRQLSALIRGFAWIVVWAPTSVTQALLATLVPGVAAGRLAALGVMLALLMMGLGWLEDHVRWRRTGQRLRASGRVVLTPDRLPRGAFAQVAGICLMLLLITLAAKWLAKVQIVHALMITAPIALVVWVGLQQLERGARGLLRGVGARLWQVADGPIPLGVREAITLGASGFIGVAAARLAPVEQIAHGLEAAGIGPAWLLAAVPALIVLAGQIALSPVTMVVFLAAVLHQLPHPPADPTLLALALASGWALSMTAAPNVTGALMLARVTGKPPVLLTWYWNGVFSLLAYGLLVGLFQLLTWLG